VYDTVTVETFQHAVRVVVVDDHPITQRGLMRELSTQPDLNMIAAFNTIESLLSNLAGLHPDVILLDLALPILPLIQCIHDIFKHALELDITPYPRIVLYSVSRDALLIALTIEAGAYGYLHQSHDVDALSSMIRDAVRGVPFSSDVLTQAQADPSVRGYLKLTRAERGVLSSLVKSGARNDAIADVRDTATSTVKKHMSAIFAKLEVQNRAGAMALMLKNRLTEPL